MDSNRFTVAKMTADEFRARLKTIWGGHGSQGQAARH
jgi:hypothetical protein